MPGVDRRPASTCLPPSPCHLYDGRMERIGFIGLGTMGAAMAGHLARAGYPLTVWNRTPGRAAALVELGAIEATTPAALAAQSDVVVICVSDSPDVEAV